MLQLLGAVAPLAKTLLGTIDKAVPDKDLAQKIKAEFNNELLNADMSKFKAAASIVESEAKSQHWVTATWRNYIKHSSRFVDFIANWIGRLCSWKIGRVHR